MSHIATITITDDDADSELLEEQGAAIRRELLDLGVDDVAQVRAGASPEGTRAIDPAVVGTLTVVFQSSLPIITGIVGVVATWLSAVRSGRAVELTIGDQTIKLAAASGEERDRLINEFLAALPRPDDEAAPPRPGEKSAREAPTP